MNAPLFSRRERQIMDVLHRVGEATAADVRDAIEDAPSYSAIRAHLRILGEKGHVTYRQDGPRYVYAPSVAPEKARRSALRHLLKTFFSDSPEQAVSALLDVAPLSESELDRLSKLIEDARRDGR
jgi:BlaI family transcriptional regulator, penicillinase repressor